jgi:hypothetical protein
MQEKSFHAGEQHPEEWRRDLNPDANAGINYGQTGDDAVQEARTAADIKELYDALPGFSKDELKQILVLSAGTRLQQGATYIDLQTPDRREFTATGDMEAGPGNWIVPKSEVDYQIWNRLIGVSNPERTGEADD